MDVRAASVLPLNSIVEDLDKLHDSVVEEPVREGWILDYCLGSGSPGVRVVGQMS